MAAEKEYTCSRGSRFHFKNGKTGNGVLLRAVLRWNCKRDQQVRTG